ncbi:MAG TPA: M28 family peptidase [Patescibacteria group bacterium]|nr:M28 family peptidase [Patescibacteria group bacterium]
MRRISSALILLVLLVPAAGAAPTFVAPRAESLQSTVDALTGPGMDGRRAGTPGGDLAARRLADWLEAAGLRPGGERESFFQSFVVAPGARVATGSILRPVGGAALQVGRDWTPHGGSLREHVTGEIAFVGYGVSAPASGYDDWAGIDVRDRVVLALDGAPAHLGGLRTSRLEKLIAARRAGARALLIVGDRLPALSATATAVRLVSGTLTPATADILLAPDASIARLTTTIAERRAPASFVAPRRVEIAVALEAADRTAVNVVGILPGREPALAGEAVVLGAHYDHLGLTGGAIYPGADDNASGTAVVVGLARAFAAAGGLDRTLVFVLFGAEEIGLVGSGHYVRHPTVPLARTVAMINFDMVGRLHDATVRVSGVDSGGSLREVASRAASEIGVSADLRGSPFGPSDHSRFYTAGTPVLFFHTGSHPDYHRPGDTADKIDAAGMARIAALGGRIAERLATGDRPVYATVARPQGDRRERGAGASPVFFGVRGEGQAESDGLRLAEIVVGSAAARAGLREGDVLVRFAERPVDSFDDLLAALRGRQPGDAVRVLYVREGIEHDTSAVLDARP